MGFDYAINRFALRRTTPMSRLKNVYSELVGLPKHLIRFRFNGQAIHDDDTPDSLEMLDNDTIETFYVQNGGGHPEIPKTPFLLTSKCPSCHFQITPLHSNFQCALNIFRQLENFTSKKPNFPSLVPNLPQCITTPQPILHKNAIPTAHSYPNIHLLLQKTQCH